MLVKLLTRLQLYDVSPCYCWSLLDLDLASTTWSSVRIWETNLALRLVQASEVGTYSLSRSVSFCKSSIKLGFESTVSKVLNGD